MLKYLVAAALAGALALATPVSSQTTNAPGRLPEIAGLSQERLANIANVLRADAERGRIPGAVVLVARPLSRKTVDYMTSDHLGGIAHGPAYSPGPGYGLGFGVRARAGVKANAVSLLGWSNSGSAVLYAVERGRAAQDGAPQGGVPQGGKPDFAKAIAFYPGCRIPVERGAWRARLPLLILIGAADDWTPAGPCQDLVATAQKLGAPASIMVYPGAYHDFDHPNLPLRTHKGLAFTGDGRGVAHTGTDTAARADAIERVPAFLAR